MLRGFEGKVDSHVLATVRSTRLRSVPAVHIVNDDFGVRHAVRKGQCRTQNEKQSRRTDSRAFHRSFLFTKGIKLDEKPGSSFGEWGEVSSSDGEGQGETAQALKIIEVMQTVAHEYFTVCNLMHFWVLEAAFSCA